MQPEEQPDTDMPTEGTFGNSVLSLGMPSEGALLWPFAMPDCTTL